MQDFTNKKWMEINSSTIELSLYPCIILQLHIYSFHFTSEDLILLQISINKNNTMFIKATLNISVGQTNIDKYIATTPYVHIILQHIISKFELKF